MNPKLFFAKHEYLLPIGLFLIFLAFTLPGIAWGAPATWHPDEIVIRSLNALTDPEYRLDENNFDYPTLPQFVMLGLGKLILALGYSITEVFIAARVLSATLAGATVVLTYSIARRVGGTVLVAALSGVLLICVSELAHNGRYAHNDTFLLFFTTLAVLFLIEYLKQANRIWLYASFFTVGLAASCKFIGGSLVLLPGAVLVLWHWADVRRARLALGETVFISATLTYLGFSLGTPKALFWMTYYFKRVFAALQWQVNYARQPDSMRGFLGQYALLANGLGLALMLLFGCAFIWMLYRVIKAYRSGSVEASSQISLYAVLLGAVIVLDLPMTISYNYQLRYFLTLMPYLAVLSAFFIEALFERAQRSGQRAYPVVVQAGVALIVLYSCARLTSLMLLTINDARLPASAYLTTLPKETSLEHTYYPPTIPAGHFAREFNYPIYFIKGDEALPTSKKFVFNAGEAGLDERQTDYLVIDSYTADKFNDPFTCQHMQVECAFFKQLAEGRSAHYRLLAEFSYTLPRWLPQIEFVFVNPAIRIYERIK